MIHDYEGVSKMAQNECGNGHVNGYLKNAKMAHLKSENEMGHFDILKISIHVTIVTPILGHFGNLS